MIGSAKAAGDGYMPYDAYDGAWNREIAVLSPQIRAYLSRLPCSDGEREEISWDLWAAVCSHETEFLEAPSKWPVVLRHLRQICRERVRVWAHEVPAESENVEARGMFEFIPSETERVAQLNAAIQLLPPLQAKALRMRYLSGQSYAAIAMRLGTSAGSVRVSVCLALKRLRRDMQSGTTRIGERSAKRDLTTAGDASSIKPSMGRPSPSAGVATGAREIRRRIGA
jgi:RNA polymerase sigma factor (sigma-70 family)